MVNQMRWSFFCENILAVFPLLLLPVELEILLVVNPVLLVITWVAPRCEVPRHVLCAIFRPPLTHSSLQVFNSIFLKCGCFHVTVFEGALVRPPSRVGWRNQTMQPFGEIINLDSKVRHAVHMVPKFRVGLLFPDDFFGAARCVDTNLVVPISSDLILQILGFSISQVNFSSQFEFFLGEPSSPFKLNLALFVWSFQVSNGHRFSNVNIHLANDKIMSAKWRQFNLISVTGGFQINVCFVLLVK